MMILEQQYHDDLKKELQGVTYTSTGSNVDKQTSTGTEEESTANAQQNDDDVADMGTLMMSRKKRKLLEAMQVTLCLSSFCRLSYLGPVWYIE